MESIIFFVFIIIGSIAANYYLRKRNGKTCPKCGKRAISAGKMIQKGTGKVVQGYKCRCGEFWYEE